MIAIFVFYNKSNGIQQQLAFSKEFRHVNVAIYEGSHWVFFEANTRGVEHRVFNTQDGGRLILKLRTIPEVSAIVGVDIGKRERFGWRPFMVYSCNEVCRFLTGVGTGFTFNPIHLYNKLFQKDKLTNYEILHAWRRNVWECSEGMIAPTQAHRIKQTRS